MVKRISILCLALLLALLYSFTGSRKERVDFSRVERRMLHIPTAGLFDGTGYFTVTSAHGTRRLEFSGGGRSVVHSRFPSRARRMVHHVARGEA